MDGGSLFTMAKILIVSYNSNFSTVTLRVTSTPQFLFTFRHSGLEGCFSFKIASKMDVSKLKITDIANSSLNLAETKLDEVRLAPPCLF